MAIKNKRKRKICDISVEEISLVDNPSNRKSFYVMKRDKSKDGQDVQDPEIEELLKDWLDEDIMKLTGEELLPKLKASLKQLATYKDVLPDDVVTAMKTYFAFIAQGAGDGGGDYGYGASPEGKTGDDEAALTDEQKAKLKKGSDRFPSWNAISILGYSRKFQKQVRKAAAADQADDQDQDGHDQDDVEEVEVLKREIATKDQLIKKLSRGKSAQVKEGVDDDEEIRKQAEVPHWSFPLFGEREY
jgi:hypothetical protein